jgi:hypothetical protein
MPDVCGGLDAGNPAGARFLDEETGFATFDCGNGYNPASLLVDGIS